MSILFDSTRPVKPARKPFASGLTPRQRFVPSAADQQWWAENSPANREGFEVVGPADSTLDDQAELFAAQAALDAGCCPYC